MANYTNYSSYTLVSGSSSADSIYNSGGTSVTISGGGGNDTIKNYAYSSGYSMTSYYGSYASISGGAGNDLISLNSDSRYAKISYASGDGNDTIYGLNSDDTLQITGSKYTTTKSGSNLIIGVGNGSISVVGGASAGFTINGTLGSGEDSATITGTAKADTLTNYDDEKYIDALAGDDYIYNYGDSVTVDAGAGNDKIYNDGYASTINGGAGADSIYNDAGYSSISGGADNDTIKNYSYHATINGGAGADSIYNSASYSSISGDDGNDTITNSGYHDTINGGAGADSIYNSANDVSISGGDGNDTITNYGYIGGASMTSYYGSYASINGGAGNDLISLNSDSRYAKISYASGDGNDTIYGLTSDDTLQITGAKYTTTKSGSNLIIGVGNGSISVVGGASTGFTIEGTLDGGGGGEDDSATITGTAKADSLTNSEDEKYIDALAGDDYIFNYGNSVTIDAGAGNDSIYNYSYVSTINGGAGADSIYNSANYSSISGDDGNDTIYNDYGYGATINGGAGKDSIYSNANYVSINGGTGNDLISLNSDSYYTKISYASGDGNDTIYGLDSDDTLQITGAKYTTTKSGSNLIIGVGNGSISVVGGASAGFTIDGTLDGGSGGEDDSATITGTAKADNLANSDDEKYIDALAGNDTISNSGDDVTIYGGKGNDSISNSGSGVIYQYANGDGKDTILGFSSNDTLEITKGSIKSSAVSGNDLILTVGSGSITLKDMQVGATVNILNADGTTSELVVPKILQGTTKADTLTNSDDEYIIDALAGNDLISNSGDNVTIIGGAGNDSISNSSYGTLYQYASGDGKDTISGFSSNDTLEITKGSIKSSLVSGEDLILTVGSGSITLKEVVGAEINLIDEKGNDTTFFVPYIHTLTKKADSFENEDDEYLVEGLGGNDSIDNFAENVTVDGGDGNDSLYNAGSTSSIYGGKGNDVIDNFADNSTINGGKGNDSIYTESQGALIQYANGDGKDLIVGFGEDDTLEITSGTIKSTTAKGMDVIVNVGSGSITLEDAAGKNINLMDSAGTLTTTILSGTWEGTAKADTYSNSADKITIYARGGNDKITNYGDNVTIDGGIGHDKITLEDGDGVTVIGGKGNDTITNEGGAARYQYAKGDGRDIIYGFSRNDTLQITSGTVSSVTTSNGDTVVKVGTGSITLKNYSSSVNLVDSKNAAISYNTLDLFEDNNFISDDTSLDSITESKFAVTQIQDTKVDELSQPVLTFAKEK